jgi:hypothetical protein
MATSQKSPSEFRLRHHIVKSESDKSKTRKFTFFAFVTLEVFLIPKPNVPVKPGDFVGREPQIDAFRSILQQGVETGTTSSVAVLGDWGIGKSSSLVKFAAISAQPEYGIFPVTYQSVPTCLTTATLQSAYWTSWAKPL